MALSAMASSSSRSASHLARSSSFSMNSALRRMRVIGVLRSWPAAATRRMRLSIAAFRRLASSFSARAVARISPGPVSGRCGSEPSGPMLAAAFSSMSSGRVILLAAKIETAALPRMISPIHMPKIFQPPGGGPICGISATSHPPFSIAIAAMGAGFPGERITIALRGSPTRASAFSRNSESIPSRSPSGGFCSIWK
ncbi:hypothetical protein D3C72_1377060 [compost metagenome]